MKKLERFKICLLGLGFYFSKYLNSWQKKKIYFSNDIEKISVDKIFMAGKMDVELFIII